MALVNITSDPPAYTYRGFQNQAWAALGLDHFSHPCLTRHDVNGETYRGSLPTDQCFRMTEPQRMKGVWIDQFEGSRFLPGGTELTQARFDEPQIWLDPETKRVPGLFNPDPDAEIRVLEVDFVGRKTLFPGQYGHMGVSQHEVIVDRLISARELDPQPWLREVGEYWDRRLGRRD
ncbi:MAG TPA: hypothetical protein VGB54_08320 [Allosphingosinicella sp.]